MDCTVVLFSGTSSGPRKYGFGVKTSVLEHAATAFFSSFDGSVEVRVESVLSGLKLLFGSTQRPHFFLKLDSEETAKSQVVG